MSQENQWLITVTVDGQPLGVFDKLSGGDSQATTVKYRPGGMVPEIDLGGPTAIQDITVTRLYDLARDHVLAKGLVAKNGRARAVVSQQPLDPFGAPYGAPIVRGGVLKGVKFPTADSMSQAASMLELDVSVDGSVG